MSLDYAAVSIDDQAGVTVVLHRTADRALSEISGLLGVGPIRSSVRVRPSGHGSIDETRYEDGRTISIGGYTTTLAAFRMVAGVLLATLDGQPALLKWTEGEGLALQRLVTLAGPVDPIITPGAPIARYEATLHAADPRAYSQTLTTSVGAALSAASGGDMFPDLFDALAPTGVDVFAVSSGGTVAFTNAGNRPTPPLLRIHGGVTNPAIVHPDGRRIALQGTIAAGDYVAVDVAARTITLVTGSQRVPRLGLLDAATTSWFELAAATTTTLQLVAADFDATARLDIIARSAYA